MVDRDLVTSGFDIEVLVSERYLTYVVLAQIEAGRLGTQFDIVDQEKGIDVGITLHPPQDYQRLYEPEPSAPLPEAFIGSLDIQLLPEDDEAFLQVTASLTIEDRASGNTFPGELAGMLLNFALEAEETDEGLEEGHELVMSLVRLDDLTRAKLNLAGVDVETVEATLRTFVDRRLPLGFGRGGRVQRLRMRRLIDGGHHSLGLYLDLALRSGPEPDAYHPPRGDLAAAQDFRGDSLISFSTSPGLFALLGPDIKFRQAEPKPGGGFSFPLRKNPLNPNSEVIGRIKDITVGPGIFFAANQPPVFTNELKLTLHGEYTDAPGDPDFDLLLFVKPRVVDGFVEIDLDVDVQLGLLATLILIAGGIILTALFAPTLAWGSTLIAGALIGLAVLRGLIAQPLAGKLIGDRIDEDAFEASFLDVLPFRLPAARRRWDPFYTTEHQAVARVSSVVVDNRGFAFDASDVVLDKEPVLVTHAVIRDKQLAQGDVAALRYRVFDFAAIAADLVANAPGRDRRDFTRVDPDGEPTLVDLDMAQIAERIDQKRIIAPLTYTAERIHVVENQIDHMLTISSRERAEARRRVINRFRAERRDVLMSLFGAALTASVTQDLEEELGREPTPEEIQEGVDAFLEPILDDFQELFESSTTFPPLVESEVERELRFELAPEQYVALQEAGILVIDGKEIIVRHNADGTITPYFRDHPDAEPSDNLLALPRYTPPFVPAA